jgi:hypothetical protein
MTDTRFDTAADFCDWLRSTLIPDYRESGMDSSAETMEEAIHWIENKTAPAPTIGHRSDSTARPDPAGMFCGTCGTDSWVKHPYICPGCNRAIPAAA